MKQINQKKDKVRVKIEVTCEKREGGGDRIRDDFKQICLFPLFIVDKMIFMLSSELIFR